MTQRDEIEQKDRFGDKLKDAEKAREDQFFAELDQKLVAQLKARKQEGPEAGGLNCPGCNQPLTVVNFQGAKGQQCSACGGVWFDRNNMDNLLPRARKKGLLGRLFGRID